MTIHSDWARIFKEECPGAFLSSTPRIKYGVGVIDGHLQLMCLHKKLPSWKYFVKYLFLNPVKKLFDAGCPRVVLCFDCYDNVPVYKNMTQLKRAKGHKVCVFNADQGLPKNIPDDPMLFLMNRDFKKKVIDMVCETLPKMIELNVGQELIIDYKRIIQYSGGMAPMVPSIVHGFEAMGESDVKFVRYAHKYGNALVHAIDGDYLAIALLYYSMYGVRRDNKIFIYRQLSSLPTKKTKLEIKQPPAKKLKIDWGCDAAAAPAVKKRKEATPKGWVDMQLVFATISRCVLDGSCTIDPRTQQLYTEGGAVHAAVLLMLCAGTDFSRGLPFLGPKTIWDNISLVRSSLLQSASIEVNDTLFLDGVVARLYRAAYANHLPPTCLSFTAVMGRLMRSSLSSSTKSKFPTENQAKTTIKNLKWVISYWKMHDGCVETPLDGTNGFSWCSSASQVIFSDKSE